MKNIMITGPCGVGKSTLAKKLSDSTNFIHFDFDVLRNKVEEDRRKNRIISPSPCSVTALDIEQCLSRFLPQPKPIIFDIGGDTVFRKEANNQERLSQVLRFKKNHTIIVILLDVDKETLYNRIILDDRRIFKEIEYIWNNWTCYSKPFWKKCTDFSINTSGLTIDEIFLQIVDLVL